VASQDGTPIAQRGSARLKEEVCECSITRKISVVSGSLQIDQSIYQSTLFLNLSYQDVGMGGFIEWKNRLTFGVVTVVKN
jgi:hypothetical protein